MGRGVAEARAGGWAAESPSATSRRSAASPAEPVAPPSADSLLAEPWAPAEPVRYVPAAEEMADELDDAEPSDHPTVLAPRAAHRRSGRVARPPVRARRGTGRPGMRTMAVAAGAVVALIVGITALVGVGRSALTSPDQGSAPVAAPPLSPPVALPPPAPPVAPAPTTPATTRAPAPKPAAPGPTGGGGTSVLSLADCTTRVTTAAALQKAVASAAPGQKICATGNMGGSRLQVSRSGTPAKPITVIGSGATPVKGITIEANNVVVAGFSAVNAAAPGIELTGNNITVRNNTVTHPTGDDYDGLRFFGDNLKILNNTISDINPDGSGAHADCMQTFATDPQSPASQNVLIDGNRCQRIDNQCLIAEGPNSSAGDGSGVGRSANIQFTNNFCQAGASQAVWIDDVQNVKLSGNTIQGTVDKAFGIANKSTGAVIAANKLASGIGFQVGMDSSSKSGYQGPAVGGEP